MIISVATIFFFAPPVFGQHEADIWPLGARAGITFKGEIPAKLDANQFKAPRITALASDPNGNLLFYTNGLKVWDRNHQEMPNGNDLALTEQESCVVIVPRPGDDSRYYIFTTRETNWGAPNGPAYYAEVDLCLNNGMGDIIPETKHSPLLSVAANRLAVVKHRNGIDYWVAFHKWQSDAFYAYRVTVSGVDPVPVISHTGVQLGFSSNSTGDGGEMKFSTDGKKLAMAVSQYASAQVYDFNSETGVFDHAVSIPAMYRQNYYTPDYTFGLEFSPDGKKLYLTRTTGCLLLQYDLSAGDDTQILKSRTIIVGDTLQHHNHDYYILYGMQLATDGKLYAVSIAQEEIAISVIRNPNEKGHACNYQYGKFAWDTESFQYDDYFFAFPAFPANYFHDRPSIGDDFDCRSPEVTLKLNFALSKNDEDIENVVWSFDDPSSGVLNQSLDRAPTHTFSSAGTYRVSATITWTDASTIVLDHLITIPSEVFNEDFVGLGDDTALCPGSTLRLDASGMGGNGTWHDGSTQSYFDVSAPGLYWYTTCRSGCFFTDSILVSTQHKIGILGPDTTLCGRGAQLLFDLAQHGEVVKWQDNSTSPTYTVKRPGTYWVTIKSNDCESTDSVTVDFCVIPLWIPNIITPNGDDDNEQFEVTGLEHATFALTVYNRHGTVVYHTTDYRNDWRGDHLSAGVYYYHIYNETQSHKGWLQIMR